jgi:hypothetical protein
MPGDIVPRPRTPSNILELRGAFKANPQRRRKDAEGAGPFNFHPPHDLPPECVPTWHEIVSRLPKVAISSSDEFAAEMAARALYAVRSLGVNGPMTAQWSKLQDTLSKWLGKLGMTPQDRTRIPAQIPADSQNTYADV